MIGFQYQRSDRRRPPTISCVIWRGSARRSRWADRRSSASSWTARTAGSIIPKAACPSCARSISAARELQGSQIRQLERLSGSQSAARHVAAPVRGKLDQPQFRHLGRPRRGQHRLGRPAQSTRALAGSARATAHPASENPGRLGGNLHRRGKRLVLVVWRRPFLRQDALFDQLFRKHLQNVYLLLGDPPPPELSRPISRRGQQPCTRCPAAFST